MIVPKAPGRTPNGFTDERWHKLVENARRAEHHTGVAPVSGEGWEIVAVLVMDKLDALLTAAESSLSQRIVLGSEVPSEPGWYLVQRENMSQPYLVGVENQNVFTVSSVLRLADFPNARWSKRLIVEDGK